MRIAVALSLVLAACGGGGGGGGSAPPAPENPNPAPGPTPLATEEIGGSWQITSLQQIGGNAVGSALTAGGIVAIGASQANPGGLYFVNYAQSAPGMPPAFASKAAIEAETGFPLDWYQNGGDGSFLDFGYGWDRLRVPGGAGQFSDYVQYGVRVIALGADMMTGYEAEWTQDFLGQPRYEWLAAVTLTR